MSDSPIKALAAEIASDPEIAWAWFCNISVPIMDATRVPSRVADQAGAHLMQHLFGHDITTDWRYSSGKSDAQIFAEMRLAADREEDAALSLANGSRGV